MQNAENLAGMGHVELWGQDRPVVQTVEWTVGTAEMAGVVLFLKIDVLRKRKGEEMMQ